MLLNHQYVDNCYLLDQEINERENAINHIESELEIVQNLVDSIELSIEKAVENTTKGVDQLKKSKNIQNLVVLLKFFKNQ